MFAGKCSLCDVTKYLGIFGIFFVASRRGKFPMQIAVSVGRVARRTPTIRNV